MNQDNVDALSLFQIVALTHYQTTGPKFRLVQIETNCRRHFKVYLKWKISTIHARKHCEKRRNCLLQAISPFLTMFFTAIYLSLVRQNEVLCGNGLTLSMDSPSITV